MPFLFAASERWGHIFVFTLDVYCCITKHPQILCLNQQTFHVITVLLEKSWNPNCAGLSSMFLLLILSGVSHMCSFIWWLIWRWMAYHDLTHKSGSLLLALSSALPSSSRELAQASLHGSLRAARKRGQKLQAQISHGGNSFTY